MVSGLHLSSIHQAEFVIHFSLGCPRIKKGLLYRNQSQMGWHFDKCMVNASPTILWRDTFFFSSFVVILLELSFRAAMSICVLVPLGRVLFAVFATNPPFANIHILELYNYISYKNDLLYNCNCVCVHVYVLVWPVLQDRKSVTCIINQWKIGSRPRVDLWRQGWTCRTLLCWTVLKFPTSVATR